jgi:hypothetical protein
MLLIYLLVLFAVSELPFAESKQLSRRRGKHVIKHGMFTGAHAKRTSRRWQNPSMLRSRATVDQRQAPSTGCGSQGLLVTEAPKTNIFAGLSDDEAAAVTSFLHEQESLNLTAAAEATS